jgi:DNA-binding NtrC family response regulator
MEKYCRLNQKKIIEIDQAALDVLQNHKWVGNVRELENTIERAVLVGNGPCISPQNFLLEASENRAESSDTFRIKAGRTVRDMEKELIFQTLQNVNDNRTQAAELLGISIRTLRNKLREYKEETAS